MPPRGRGSIQVPPSAARLSGSLRDIGYNFSTAVADLVDNSVAAGASRVDVDICFDPEGSYVLIGDDGRGMTANGLTEAMRFGTRRSYALAELGRYGLGLKTASLSQCRSLTVVTRRSPVNRVITERTLDLDLIQKHDLWLVTESVEYTTGIARAVARLDNGPGTVVVWEKLDRVLPYKSPDGGWAKRRLASHAERLREHLGMVFHRFLEGSTGGSPLTITVNGEKVVPWDPFAPSEPATFRLPEQVFELRAQRVFGEVTLRPFVLPARHRFSSHAEWERLSGPLKWNRQQGLYIYRADRLIQWGGWSGMRAIDEHTKLARAALDFNTDLDEVFHINVAKMRVSIPTELRQMLERPIHELCVRANDAYRKTAEEEPKSPRSDQGRGPVGLPSIGVALAAAAMELGHTQALTEILGLIKSRDPELAAALGKPSDG